MMVFTRGSRMVNNIKIVYFLIKTRSSGATPELKSSIVCSDSRIRCHEIECHDRVSVS